MNVKQLVKDVRCAVRDVAFQFRMGSGFPGDVNRTHPASIEPALQSNTPATAFGQVVLIAADGTNGVRPIVAADQGAGPLLPWGFTVRPFPLQAPSAPSPFGQDNLGTGTPPTVGVIDILRSGYIIGLLNKGSANPVKGGTVYVWATATVGNHIQGGLETAASVGNTVPLDARYTYNGPADASGFVEICANV